MPCLGQSIVEAAPELQEVMGELREARTLAAMIMAAWQVARRVGARLVEEQLAERASEPQSWPACPKCGRSLESKGMAKRAIRSVLGLLRWRRRVGRCPKGCAIGLVAPLDEELDIAPRQQVSQEIKQAACTLAVFVPFGVVVELIGRLWGVVVSAAGAWHWVQAAGREVQVGVETELACDAAVAPEPPDAALSSSPLLMGVDGVMAPFRPQAGTPKGRTVWQEIKVGIFARSLARLTRAGKAVTRLAGRRLVAVRGDVDALGERMAVEATRQDLDHAPLKVHAYLTRLRPHLDYDRFRALGLPIGSGMVESACKWLVQQRFKGVGMRWSESGFDHLLHLRLAWVNHRFDHLFLPDLRASPNG